jgi:hypothetical protein
MIFLFSFLTLLLLSRLVFSFTMRVCFVCCFEVITLGQGNFWKTKSWFIPHWIFIRKEKSKWSVLVFSHCQRKQQAQRFFVLFPLVEIICQHMTSPCWNKNHTIWVCSFLHYVHKEVDFIFFKTNMEGDVTTLLTKSDDLLETTDCIKSNNASVSYDNLLFYFKYL